MCRWFWAAILMAVMVVRIQVINISEAGSPQPLKLEKPEYEWIRCSCPNGTELGLTEGDFIKHQMYVSGLEHVKNECQMDGGEVTRFVRND